MITQYKYLFKHKPINIWPNSGINIPQNKVVSIALTHSWNWCSFFKQICKKLNISDKTRVNQLTEDQVLKLESILTKIIKWKVIYVRFLLTLKD